MKFIDEKGRIGSKVSIVDIFAVLLLVACILAVGLKFKAAEEVVGGERTVVFEVMAKELRDVSVDAIKNSKNARDFENKKDLGVITDVKEFPAEVLVQLNDGTYDYVYYPNRYDVVVTIEADGSETDDGYYTASGRQVCPGEKVGVATENSRFTGEIISVEVK